MSLKLYIGPMYSGKTSKLLEIFKQCSFCNIPVIVINHASDIRYHESMLSTHDKVMIPCIQTHSLSEIWNHKDVNSSFNNTSLSHLKVRSAEVILINEGQFFEDLYDCVIDMLKENKQLYIAGLDGDFERNKFGQMLDLIPICDEVTKLTSLCSICKNGKPGIFSLRLSSEKQQTVVGSDNYIPVCRSCYTNSNSFH
uniref:thymidine kinase n=1 Tax=viral metagenome TaxID=1070528 RepID=A0A6C0D870_9ZZZZ